MMKLPGHLLRPSTEIYLSDNYLVLDFETDGFPLDPKASIVLTGWKKHGHEYQRHFGDEYTLGRLQLAIASCDYIVAQNAKFELQWLGRAGIDTSVLIVADTMLAEYCILGNRRGPKNLDALGEKYCGKTKGGLVSSLFKGGALSSDIPRRWLEEYNRQDVLLTEEVWRKQRETLRERGLLSVFFTRCLTTIPLAEIETRGLYLDKDKVKLKLDEYEVLHSGLLTKLNNVAGGVNWNSPKQVGELLYGTLGFDEPVDYRGELSRTESGGRRTDEECISSLRAITAPQRTFKGTFVDYRKAAKSLRDLQKMWQACEEDGGLIYGTLNQSITQTHRLSSTGGKYKLQLHNFDRDFKGLFTARYPGYSVGESDGRQLEFRVAVHLGKDAQGLEDVRANFDIHRNTASVMLDKLPADVTSAERTSVKPDTFGPLYGKTTGSPRLRAYIEAFRKRYNGIYDEQRSWTFKVLTTGELRTCTGLIFYWPDTKQRRSGYIDNTPSIFNYPVQSLATADIIPVSVIYLWHLMRAAGLKSFLVNTVHDSVIAEIAPGEEKIFAELCREAFTRYVFDFLKVVYGIRFICPLGCETKVGTHWGDGSVLKEEFDLDPDLYFKES